MVNYMGAAFEAENACLLLGMPHSSPGSRSCARSCPGLRARASLQVARRVKMRLEAMLVGSANADPIRFSVPGYRARLYELRFGATPGAQHMLPLRPRLRLPSRRQL